MTPSPYPGWSTKCSQIGGEVSGISESHIIFQIKASTPDQTRDLGVMFGRLLSQGDVVNLTGPLGAGKTLFVKGMAKGLGIDEDHVQSPTFTLVRQYEGEVRLYHLDLYRLENIEDDLEGIGYEDYFYPEDAVTAIEWGDLAESLLPADRFDVQIQMIDTGRHIVITAYDQPSERVLSIYNALSDRARGEVP